ncbi:MAG: FAD-dependent oxidoreductase, partial [Acetobacteraceae bacterium]|nr:FAD-dependent oxidoreductase [Acetobacteraceae bacterium]
MAAAHRLLEQGFDVTLFEANDYLGGKLGAVLESRTGDFHEHCYHMYLSWYHNFWALMDEIGVRQHFLPMPTFGCLKPGQYGEHYEIMNLGSPSTALRNIFSGIMHPADMFIYGYSLLDLIGTTPFRGNTLERTSVLAFMTSRPYNTREAMTGSTRTLAEAFACPSYLSSARSYKSLIKLGVRQPSPSMWLLTGNTQERLFAPWRAYLEARAGAGWGKLSIRQLKSVRQLRVADGRIDRIEVADMPHSLPPNRGAIVEPVGRDWIPLNGDLILAIPPRQLAGLISFEVAEYAPNLADVRRLRCEPMISLTVPFKLKLGDIPIGITVLLDSRYELSFLDQSQIWRNSDGNTLLNVVASDADTLVDFPEGDIIWLLLRELSRFIKFAEDDVDRERLYLQTNVGEELLVNQVGSWEYRPQTTCEIANLLIAGDFCRNAVDVVTIEGAVVSGLNAAQAVCDHYGRGDAIAITKPDPYPEAPLAALALAGLPFAYAAKAISTSDRI